MTRRSSTWIATLAAGLGAILWGGAVNASVYAPQDQRRAILAPDAHEAAYAKRGLARLTPAEKTTLRACGTLACGAGASIGTACVVDTLYSVGIAPPAGHEVVMTAAHTLVDADGAARWCRFVPGADAIGELDHEADLRAVGVGLAYAARMGALDPHTAGDASDWAFALTAKPLPDDHPRLRLAPGAARVGAPLLQPGHALDLRAMRVAGKCAIGEPQGLPIGFLFHDCACLHGCSGAATLARTASEPVAVGIYVGGSRQDGPLERFDPRPGGAFEASIALTDAHLSALAAFVRAHGGRAIASDSPSQSVASDTEGALSKR